MFSGLSRSVSRVAGPPPRTSTPQVAPSGAMKTVQPVPARASSACAQRNAGKSASVAGCSMAFSLATGRIDSLIVHRGSQRSRTDVGLREAGFGSKVDSSLATHSPRRREWIICRNSSRRRRAEAVVRCISSRGARYLAPTSSLSFCASGTSRGSSSRPTASARRVLRWNTPIRCSRSSMWSGSTAAARASCAISIAAS